MDLVVLLCQFAWGCALQRENCINWRPLSWKNVALGQELPWEVLCSFVFVGFLWLLGVFLVVVALFFKCISRIHQFSCNSILWEIRVQGYLKLSGNQHIPCPTLFSQNLAPAARVSSRLCPPCKLTLLHSRKHKEILFVSPVFLHPALYSRSLRRVLEPRNLLDSLHLQDFPHFLPISHYFTWPPPPFCCPSFNPTQEEKAVIIYYQPLFKFCHDYLCAKASQNRNAVAELALCEIFAGAEAVWACLTRDEVWRSLTPQTQIH